MTSTNPNTDNLTHIQEIELPLNLSRSKTHLAIDIGGSLAKITYYTPGTKDAPGKLNFIKFTTGNLSPCIEFVRSILSCDTAGAGERSPMVATGGGAHRFIEELNTAVSPRQVLNFDEMSSLISGVDYLIGNVPDEVFTYEIVDGEPKHQKIIPSSETSYPYLLVNIGSGVSIVKVTSPGQYVRVSGTSLGGGTFLGLASLLTGLDSFDEILALSQKGQNQNVDMLVGDIYGDKCPIAGLKSTAIASSMGKVYRRDLHSPSHDTKTGFQPEDLCSSLLYTISNNIGQIAYLNAVKHNISHIYFGGYFIRGHQVTMITLQKAIHFWSQGSVDARFLRHEGYLGALGSLVLSSQPQQ